MLKPPKESCVSCQFFIQRFSKETYTNPNSDCRENARNNHFEWVNENSFLECYFLVWAEGHGTYRQERFDTIILKNRRDFCFYWPYHPEMMMPAAETLQKRDVEAKETRRTRKLARTSIWISFFALEALT
jgi:hypothetical protein